MREIRFRVWDKKSKMYLKRFNVDLLDIDTDILSAVELCQYTGLKDKNGVEIYEGDIVKVPHFSHDERIKINGVVKYVDNRAEFVIDLEDIEETFYCCNQSERFEVVGNIYENPELLEENDVEM